MKTPGRALQCALAALLAAPAGLHAELQWRGTIVGPRGTTFALTDTATGESRWVALGSRFGAFSVLQYDPTRQVLVLSRDGERTELSLAAAPVTEGKSSVPAVPKPEDAIEIAQGMATRGDVTAATLLQEHSNATIQVNDLRRRISELEKQAAAAADKASTGSQKQPPTEALSLLTRELETAIEKQAALTAQLQALAKRDRDTNSGRR